VWLIFRSLQKNTIRKLANIFAFYKTILPINLAISILPLLFGGLSFFEAVFLTFGFFVGILFKEVRAKNEYSFYNNNGISNMQLWVLSYILNFFSLVIVVFCINLIMKLF
jgi:hypothetical protein